MEKFDFNNKEKNKDPKKISNLSTWLKAAALSVGILASQPNFAQNSEKNDDSLKYKTELLQQISSAYKQASELSGLILDLMNHNNYSKEQIANMEKEFEEKINNYNEIISNPEKFYEKLLNEISSIRENLISHFSSPEFLNKLQQKLNTKNARKKQQEIINNLNSVKIIITTPSHIKKLTQNEGNACYDLNEHSIYVPFIGFNDEIITHELIHGAYNSTESLSNDDIKILYKLYKKNKKVDNEYQRNPAERITRKKLLDFELDRLGIKKYDEKFTKEHYNKLLELKNKNNLSRTANDILNTITEKQLIELMNTIAFEDAYQNMSKDISKENFT
jgi:hypothetical protein